MSQVCDGIADCSDESDENTARCNQVPANCSSTTAGCSHGCQDLPFGGVKCLCPRGQELKSDGQTCQDINECLQWGVCDQRCENLPGKNDTAGYKCLCDPGFVHRHIANSRNTTCRPEKDDGESLVITEVQHAIYAVDVDKQKPHPLLINTANQLHIMGMTVNMTGDEPRLIFTNYGADKTIQTLTIKRKRRKRSADRYSLVTLQIPGVVEPRGIAYDWINDCIYWVDRAAIKMAKVVAMDKYKVRTVVSTKLDHPHDIALDPESSQLFWTEWGSNPCILVSDTEGAKSTVLVSTNVLWPSSLAVDYRNRRLYWTDAKAGRIETVNIDGTDRHVVKQFDLVKSHMPVMVDIFNDRLIYSTHANGTYSMPKFGGPAKLLMPSYGQLPAIVTVYGTKQKNYANETFTSACSRKPCHDSAVCLNKLGEDNRLSQYTCLCLDGTRWDGSACVDLSGPSCVSNPCLHNGTCLTNEKHDVKCRCLDGYSGELCQVDECENHCYNGATCHRGQSQVSCECQPGYTGPRCEMYRCLGHCYNNGYCVIELSGLPKCLCNYKYEGDRCEVKKKDICENYCFNGAPCLIINSQPHCRCLPFYTGSRCEKCQFWETITECKNGGVCHVTPSRPSEHQCKCTELYDNRTNCKDPLCDGYCPQGSGCRVVGGQRKCYCKPNYCSGHGSCHVTSTSLTCDCDSGWAGPTCSQSTSGCNRPCANGGHCVVAQGKMACQCTSQWTGVNCTEPSPCRAYCFNGGTCVNCNPDTGQCGQCSCTDKWYGSRCETFGSPSITPTGAATTSTANMVAAVIIPIIVCILVAVVVLAVCLHRRRRRGAKQFGHRRMKESNNLEISNPLYMKDEDDDDDEGAVGYEEVPFNNDLQPDESTNFENPMYRLSNDSGHLEKKQLLEDD